jgi:hypothetical protein
MAAPAPRSGTRVVAQGNQATAPAYLPGLSRYFSPVA